MNTQSKGTVLTTAGMVRGLLEGFFLPLTGAKILLRSPRARRQALYPLIASLLVYALIIFIAIWLTNRFAPQPVAWEFWWKLGATLSATVNYLLPIIKWLVCIPLLLAVCFFTFSFVGMIIASPFNDLLSESMEGKITGGREAETFSIKLTLRSMLISLYSSLRIVCKQGLCALVCLPLLFIPVVGAVLMFLVMAYFTGLGFLDIGMARNYLRYPHKMVAAKEWRWQLIGLGAAIELLLLIPLTGLLVLPLGVAGGTVLYCRIDWQRLLAKHNLEFPQGFTPPIRSDANLVD